MLFWATFPHYRYNIKIHIACSKHRVQNPASKEIAQKCKITAYIFKKIYMGCGTTLA
jgi:hypothetical protein